jgi:hypothetical protein
MSDLPSKVQGFDAIRSQTQERAKLNVKKDSGFGAEIAE